MFGDGHELQGPPPSHRHHGARAFASCGGRALMYDVDGVDIGDDADDDISP